VCSKNDDAIAREPFEKHPDMVLRLSDIAVFVANWENKVDNLRHVQRVLNIGFDAMVFIDDSPFERGMVRTGIPELCVPELPADPADYALYLRGLNLFETASFSEEDSQRTRQYQEEAKRSAAQHTFADEDEYLASLDMVSVVKPFDRFDTPRIAQLSQRSNQFNLRTVRYTERDIEQLRDDPNVIGLSFSLADQYGEHGLIAVAIVRDQGGGEGFIDTWLMSCRVLKRGMEQFVLNTLAAAARERGLARLVGEYLPTAKNALVKDHYRALGFQPDGERWSLALNGFVPGRVHIREKKAP
jgi:FkbH-like protein